MTERVGFWIGLPVGPGHVTIVIRHGCDPGEVENFKQILTNEIAPLLPIPLVFQRDVIMRGYKNDVPTLNVTTDTRTLAILKDIYRRNYQQIPEHTSYPELEMHMTVDSDELLMTAAAILDVSWGNYIAYSATLKKVGDKTLIASVKK
jgi:hypothetical protein